MFSVNITVGLSREAGQRNLPGRRRYPGGVAHGGYRRHKFINLNTGFIIFNAEFINLNAEFIIYL